MSDQNEWILDALECERVANFVELHAPIPPAELLADAGPNYFKWVRDICLGWYDRGEEWREAAAQLFISLARKHALLRRLYEANGNPDVIAALTYGRAQFEDAMRRFDPDA